MNIKKNALSTVLGALLFSISWQTAAFSKPSVSFQVTWPIYEQTTYPNYLGFLSWQERAQLRARVNEYAPLSFAFMVGLMGLGFLSVVNDPSCTVNEANQCLKTSLCCFYASSLSVLTYFLNQTQCCLNLTCK